MSIYANYFPLGLGTCRFPISASDDEEGVEKSVEIVLRALESGVNYIDTSYTYSAGMAQTVLRSAFTRTVKPYGVTVKSQYGQDKTSDDARTRVEYQLEKMGVDRAAFFVSWSIMSYEEFEKITQKGGIYDGAVKLKDEGIIDHICFSAHAAPSDIVRVIESGAFEGVTISYSPINSAGMRPVLDAAIKHGVGVAVMNPLGGGLIPQNSDYFSFLRNERDKSAVHAALRYAAAQPAINIVLSGCASIEQLEDSLSAIRGENAEPDEERAARVNSRLKSAMPSFCTGCRYCADSCPKNIPIPEFMQSYNMLRFEPSSLYNRNEPELLKNVHLLRKLVFDFQLLPENAMNPCIRCGQCERKCTQKLSVCDALDDIYNRIKLTGCSKEAMKARLEEILDGKAYKKIGLYPSGKPSNMFIELHREFFGEPRFEALCFDSNPLLTGTISSGLAVHAPSDIAELAPDAIIITSYTHTEAIYNALAKYHEQGVEIIKLYGENDVPWAW
ncbi:hypothetical protein FACS1894216_11960 [Synergistales bacterium]|nr:hypothetical protein FACS1894216_11960 [Synergistales bacterium]